jgi:ribosome-binding protein aMBF1 (putative translation factor)
MENQDWEPVRIRGTATAAGGTAPRRVSNEARRLAAVERSELPKKPKYLTPASVQALQNYRRENNLTQKVLNQHLGFAANTINGLEARTLSPTQYHLNTLNSLLKTGLTIDHSD